VQLESESQAVLRIVDGVRRIAQQSNILSFNIAIESGHLGNKDNGFVFIADQVRKLAQDVDKLAGRLSGQIGDIMQRVIVDSEAMALTRQAAEAADLADLSTALGELNGDFDTLVGHQRDVLAKVADSSEAVAAPILAMMGSVQFQDITRQQIEQLTTTVGKVDTRIAQLADTLQTGAEETPAPDMTELLDGLFDSYVMDGQRGAHLAAKGDDAPVASGALIELF
jgi:methyl-accepting chemotaxis protein